MHGVRWWGPYASRFFVGVVGWLAASRVLVVVVLCSEDSSSLEGQKKCLRQHLLSQVGVALEVFHRARWDTRAPWGGR